MCLIYIHLCLILPGQLMIKFCMQLYFIMLASIYKRLQITVDKNPNKRRGIIFCVKSREATLSDFKISPLFFKQF